MTGLLGLPAFDSLPRRIRDAADSQILQVAARALARPDALRLYAGESDLPTPEFIVAAAAQAMREGHTRYVLSRGIEPLRDAIARYHLRTYDTPVQADRISVTVGGMQALSLTLQAILEPGDQIIVPVPVWPNIIEAARLVGAEPVLVREAFDEACGWQVDIEALLAAVTPRTRAIFINSPGNPTGATLTLAQLRRLLDHCRSRGIWIVADEVYNRMNHDDARHAPSFIPLIDPEDRVIVTNTFSKNWSMTGWRCGWVVAPRSMGPAWDNLLQYGSTGVTTFVQHAAIAAIDHGDEHIARMRSQIREARQVICDALASSPRARMAPPAGAFYLFFSVQGLRDSRQFAFDLLDATGVALAPGSAFGPQGEGWMRLCFGVSMPTLRTAAQRLVPFVDAWRP